MKLLRKLALALTLPVVMLLPGCGYYGYYPYHTTSVYHHYTTTVHHVYTHHYTTHHVYVYHHH